ncbi:hypothetical protein [Kineococcus sp. SYSU DK005]|uniref:hypothetical protein n=1 Tax=Kineococcus sp. SYSU DK005 TaxID=3383126 RepID=UPI003D7C7449
MHHRRAFEGWAAWFLVLAAALPVAVIARLAWKVLTGSADDPSTSPQRVLHGADLLGARWSSFWAIQSMPLLPLMTLVPLVLLAAVVLTAPALTAPARALVPTPLARAAATLVAATTTGLAALGCAGVSTQVLGWLPGLGWGYVTGSQVEAYAPLAAVVLTTSVTAATLTAILWPRKSQGRTSEALTGPRTDQDADHDALQDAEQDVAKDRTDAEGPGGQLTPEALAPEAPTREALEPKPARQHLSAPQGVPVPSASELELYRRR